MGKDIQYEPILDIGLAGKTLLQTLNTAIWDRKKSCFMQIVKKKKKARKIPFQKHDWIHQLDVVLWASSQAESSSNLHFPQWNWKYTYRIVEYGFVK